MGKSGDAATHEPTVVAAASTEANAYVLSLRDVIVAIPIVGGTLAISYDVGFFYEIDIAYFTLFSLAEHIVFALQAIPIAFGAALTFLAGYVAFQKGRQSARTAIAEIGQATTDEERSARAKSYLRKRDREKKIFTVIQIALIAVGVVGIVLKSYLFGPMAITLGIWGLSVVCFPPHEHFPNLSIYFVAVSSVMLLIVSFFAGVSNAQDLLAQTQPDKAITLTQSIQEIRGRVIRAGERGLLFFDPDSKMIVFLGWNEIKRIQSVTAR
jgi:hypothetical protein